MTLLTTTRDLLVLDRVDETIDTFLMQVEGLFGAIVESFKLMHVNETIKRRGQKHVQVFIVLDLGDPTPVRVNFDACKVLFTALVLGRSLVFEGDFLLLSWSELFLLVLPFGERLLTIVTVVVT